MTTIIPYLYVKLIPLKPEAQAIVDWYGAIWLCVRKVGQQVTLQSAHRAHMPPHQPDDFVWLTVHETQDTHFHMEGSSCFQPPDTTRCQHDVTPHPQSEAPSLPSVKE